MSNKRVYLAVIIIRSIYAGMQIITKIAFNGGMSTYVFVVYRQAFATLLLAPIALLLERKTAPPLPPLLCFKIFTVSLFTITGSFNLYNIALDYTSATCASASMNTIPVVTFILAVLLRLESVNLKQFSGIAKVCGVALCVAGVVMIAFYKGLFIQSPNHHLLLGHETHNPEGTRAKSSKTWVLGTFIMVMGNSLFASWIVFQGFLLKEYPSILLLNTLQSFFSTVQSLIVALAVERDISRWKLGFNMGLFSVAYCGIIVTGLSFYLQTWCIKKRGPVFLAMSMPLTLVITIAVSLFILGEQINLQSILGGILLIGGLYCVLLVKSKEATANKIQTVEDGTVRAEEMYAEPSLPRNQTM